MATARSACCPPLSLILAMTGRAAEHADLAGQGVAILEQRADAARLAQQ
jgi:hypothetical protein